MSIERRLERIEKEVKSEIVIPESERIITIAAHTNEEFEAIKQERIEELRRKYGANASEEDLLIIFVKKFT